jgi:signal transduction histidine kinase
LAIARGIIDAHEGRIWIESNLDGGADFRFVLPLKPQSIPKRANIQSEEGANVL